MQNYGRAMTIRRAHTWLNDAFSERGADMAATRQAGMKRQLMQESLSLNADGRLSQDNSGNY